MSEPLSAAFAQAHAVLANNSVPVRISDNKFLDRLMSYTIYPYGVLEQAKMKLQKDATIRRLNRIEGQVRGISRMIEEERYCIDVLQQMLAIKSALAKVEDAILKDHAATCVESAIASGDEKDQRQKFGELVDLLSKVKR